MSMESQILLMEVWVYVKGRKFIIEGKGER